MGAIQAQDYGQALWAIGARLRQGTVADVERAIAEGRILRTWPMRGTLHFVAPALAKAMVAASAPRMLASTRRRREQLGLDEGVLARAMALFARVLGGRQAMTRPALMERLREAGIAPDGQRGYHLLYHAAQTGLICVGPMAGKQQTFVLLDEWAPAREDLGREELLARLAGTYFRSHAPATEQDFAWWAGLTLADARRAAAGLEEPEDRAAPAARVHLLPGYDEFLLGYRDRSAVLDPAHADRVVPGGNGVFKAIVVVDGRVVGTWKKSPRVEVELFEPVAGIEDGLAAERARHARFLAKS
jgi:hypothetical protein